MTSKVR